MRKKDYIKYNTLIFGKSGAKEMLNAKGRLNTK